MAPTSAGFALADAEPAGDGIVRIDAAVAAGTRLTITAAAQRAHARHGYLARLELDTPRSATDTASCELSLSTTAVHLQLPVGFERAGPLRLRRVDDQMWLPMLHGTSGVTLERGRELTLRLGAGSYRLQDPLRAGDSQPFDVPAQSEVVLSEALARAPDDRP